jgi:hypothetical protein
VEDEVPGPNSSARGAQLNRQGAMNQRLEPGLPIVRRVANICAWVALIPLISLLEWVPNLLPRSPNLAYSQNPFIASISFPVGAGVLALLGLMSWLLLRRLHWSGLVAFTVYWLVFLTTLLVQALKIEAPDYMTILGLSVVVAAPIVLAYELFTNWRLALRPNTSPRSLGGS